jgi:hypothetical protein
MTTLEYICRVPIDFRSRLREVKPRSVEARGPSLHVFGDLNHRPESVPEENRNEEKVGGTF